jgi:hypothetical protein
MVYKDYIMLQIEQFARALGKAFFSLIGLKKQGRVSESIEFTSRSLISELDIDLDHLVTLSKDELIGTLTSTAGFDHANMDRLAKILMQTGDSYYTLNDTDRGKRFSQASLFIYEYLEEQDKTYSIDRREKIEKLKKLVAHQEE